MAGNARYVPMIFPAAPAPQEFRQSPWRRGLPADAALGGANRVAPARCCQGSSGGGRLLNAQHHSAEKRREILAWRGLGVWYAYC